MANTDFSVLLKAELDRAGIDADLKKVQEIVKKYHLELTPDLQTASLRNKFKSICKEMANDFNKSFNANVSGNDVFKVYENKARQLQQTLQKANGIQLKLDAGNYDTQILSYKTSLEKLGLSATEVSDKMKGVNTAFQTLKTSATGNNIIPDNVVNNAKTLDTELSKLSNTVKQIKLRDALRADDLKVDNTIVRLNEQLRKNSAYSKDAKNQVKAWIAELTKGNVAETRLKEINSEAKKLHAFMASTNKIGFSRFDKLKQGMESFTSWLSATTIIMGVGHSIKNAASFAKELDSALTNINYTMDVTKSQLTDIGNSSIQMAKDLKTSADNVLGAVTLYANAKETADSILKKSEAAIMLSNVTGMTGEQSAKALQSVMNQFELTQDDLMYISDTIQKVSQNMAYDFSSGIEEIVGGIERSGSVAKAAGLDLSEYASMLGLVIEKTGLSGETIGTAYRTILTRITKASKIEGTTEDDISKAETALKAVGVQVRSSAGEFRDMTDIMKDLGKVWNDLNDVQQANISFEIAGTRQTNIVKTLLGYWTDYEDLAAKAGDAAGTTLENQGKYEETLDAKTKKLTTTMQSFWHNLIGAEEANGALEVFQSIATALDAISGKLGSLGSIGLSAGLLASFKNVGGLKVQSLIVLNCR